jgi:RNA polymerase sigma-70 factor (sigma-E family)
VATIGPPGVVDQAEVAVDDFAAYVTTAWPRLLRSAWLLTGDWHLAEDLLQTVLARAHGRWPRLRAGSPDAYLRAMLATTYLSWRRRRWRGELPTRLLPERAQPDINAQVDLQESVRRALAALPRQQRAVLMLRFHADLTEAATADTLGIGVGTVKSYTARALAALRADRSLRELIGAENVSEGGDGGLQSPD